MVLLVLLGIVLSIPSVQTAIAGKVTRSINEKYQVSIHIEKVKIGLFFGDIALQGVYIEDHRKDTLIAIDRVSTSLLSVRNAINGKLRFGDMDIEALRLYMKTYKGEEDTNLDIFIAKLEDTTAVSQEPFLLSSSHIRLTKSRFMLVDENAEAPEVLNFKAVNAGIDDFKVEDVDIKGNIEHLNLRWSNGLVIREMTAGFSYTEQKIQFSDLSALTSHSHLQGELAFLYEDKEALSDFVNKVKIEAKFENSVVALDELNIFYDGFGKGKEAGFSSKISGTLNALELDDLHLVSGNSTVDGNFTLHRLFTREEPYKVEAEVSRASSSYYQLKALLPGILKNTLPPSLEKLGQFSVKGTTVLTPVTVDADVDMYTGLGSGSGNIRLNNIDNENTVTYEGDISLREFDVGQLLGEESLGRVTLDMKVEGQGFTKEALNTEVIGKISSIYYNRYNYKDIEVSGIVKDQLFDGTLIAHDKNFQVDFKGLVDFSGATNTFNFKAVADHIDLKKLNFVTRDEVSVFKGEIRVNMAGNTIDDVTGTISFLHTNYINQNDDYYFGDFTVTSSFNGEERILNITSPDIITGYVKGKFYFNEVDKLVQNSIGSIYTNYNPHPIAPDQHMEFNLTIYNKIVEVFYPEIDFGKNTSIRGSMTADNGEFKLTFKSPHISLFDVILDDINFQIDNKNPLFNTYMEIGKVTTPLYDISEFNLINTKIADTLYFRTEFKGGEERADEYNLNFYHTFNNDEKSVVGIKTSEVSFKGNQWYLNRENNNKNKVVLNKTLDTIDIQEIVMNHENEQINLSGNLIDSTYKDIKLQFKDVSLEKITPSIDSLSLGGLINGHLNILQTGGGYLPSSNLTISDFSINNNELGYLTMEVIGRDNLSRYDVNVNLTNEGLESLDVTGNIIMADETSKIDLDASLKNFNLAMFSPLGGEAISDIRGYASGKVSVSGSLKNPAVNGDIFLEEAGLRIPYLNVDADIANHTKVALYGHSFVFNDAVLTDTEYETRAMLNGSISHDNFKNWYMDLTLDTQGNRFLVLNTPETEDALYYGTGFMSGTAYIYGYTDRLNVNVEASTAAGTSLKIPISDVTDVGDVSFINFIDKNEKDSLYLERELSEYGGLEMEFDLDVTPDAEVEIVIDKRSGSSLKGTGAGNLLIEINTNGKFRMWGDFITYTGTYNFKYGGIIDKRFKVLPGGTINWEGDPMNATINMSAVYSLYANPSALLESNNFTKKVATEVVIQLEGDLEQIYPNFEIRFPGMNSVTSAELQYHLDEQDKRQLQALSLLSQGTFIGGGGITQQAFTGNLIQTASGLVNEILNDGDGKFDVGLSYEQGGRTPYSDLQLEDRLGVTISTQISDRILVNGKIGVPVGGVTETVVAGDVEVQILLNEDGTLSAKIFNKENEIQQFLGDQQGYTQGVGLSYQVEFDTFRELFRKIFKKKDKSPEEEEEPQKTGDDGLINFSGKDEKKKSKAPK